MVHITKNSGDKQYKVSRDVLQAIAGSRRVSAWDVVLYIMLTRAKRVNGVIDGYTSADGRVGVRFDVPRHLLRDNPVMAFLEFAIGIVMLAFGGENKASKQYTANDATDRKMTDLGFVGWKRVGRFGYSFDLEATLANKKSKIVVLLTEYGNEDFCGYMLNDAPEEAQLGGYRDNSKSKSDKPKKSRQTQLRDNARVTQKRIADKAEEGKADRDLVTFLAQATKGADSPATVVLGQIKNLTLKDLAELYPQAIAYFESKLEPTSA